MSPTWAERWLGIPYRPRGRTKAGMDCFGLILAVSRDVFGRNPPDQDYTDPAAADHLWQRRFDLGRRVTDPQPGDVVILKPAGIAHHGGIMIDSRSFLHVLEGGTSCIERVDSIKWARRVDSYWRWL